MKMKRIFTSLCLALIMALSISPLSISTVVAEDPDPTPSRPVYATPAVQKLQDDLYERLANFHQTMGAEFFAAEEYLGKAPGEVEPDELQIMFHGAWYYNTETAMDSWIGIDGVITLPEVRQDNDRTNENGGRYLDNPSIYMGVTGIRESDVGLTWERMCEDTDEVNPSISTQGMGFRPFWRYINETGNNQYFNCDKFYYQTYFFPGDTVRMALLGTSAEMCVLYVKLIKPTTIPKYVAFRQRLNIREEFEFVTEEFSAPGLRSQPIAFKVANAIDQANNEGKPTKKTNTLVTGAVWHNTYVYRMIEGTMRKLPFNKERTVRMAAPTAAGYLIDIDHPLNATTGYRTVDIVPRFATDYNPPA